MSIDWNNPKIRENIEGILRGATKQDAWPVERIVNNLLINQVICACSDSEINRLKKQIIDWKNGASIDDSLRYLANDGRGYYIPRTEDECFKLEIRRKKVAFGFQESAKKFEMRRHVIKKEQKISQMTMFAEEG